MTAAASTNLDAALRLAKLGWRVFPLHAPIGHGQAASCTCGKPGCKHAGKHPRTKHGLKDASTDVARITRWWTDWPEANIGVATGASCGSHGVLVLDVDPRHQGDTSLTELEAGHGELPATVRARTGGGGEHVFFRHPGQAGGMIKSRANFCKHSPGLDLKTDGGYVVVAPSTHASGSLYMWNDGAAPWDVEPATMPAWLLRLAQEPSRAGSARSARGRSGLRGRSTPPIPDGARNQTLTSHAGRLRRQGKSESEIADALLEMNQTSCSPPLDEAEVRQIAASVAQYPAGPQADESGPVPYADVDNRLYWIKDTREGQVHVQITNFSAQIIKDIEEDDGVEQRRSFELTARLGSLVRTITLTAEQFRQMRWPLEHLGSSAVLFPGFGAEARAAAAIQLLSKGAEREARYAHTGWKKLPCGWVYLHSGGAVAGAGVPTADLAQVRTSNESLQAFALPEPPEHEKLMAGIRAVVGLLEVAPIRITIPLLAGVVRAVLGRPDFSLFVVGRTNTFKSELASLVQRFFGAGMDARSLPGSWTSTGNALEDLAFMTKDAVLVIDDFKPSGDSVGDAKLNAQADRVLRSLGNGSARRRMRADGSLRPQRPPRALIVSTGEELPRGESLRTRMLIMEIAPGDVSKERLTRCQRDAASGLYAAVTAALCQWLAGRFDQVQSELKTRTETLRHEWSAKPGLLGRQYTMLAELQAVLEIFLQFLQETTDEQVLTAEQAEAFMVRAGEAFEEIAVAQAAHVASIDPVDRYFELLRTALASGRAYLCGPNGDRPEHAYRWGWSSDDAGELRPRGRQIGWVNGPDVYLLPDAAFQAANEAAPYQQGVPIAEQTLRRRLKERGLLKSTEPERSSLLLRKTLGGVRHKVLHLNAEVVAPTGRDDADPEVGEGGA